MLTPSLPHCGREGGAVKLLKSSSLVRHIICYIIDIFYLKGSSPLLFVNLYPGYSLRR